jgi:hypothetical protein
VTELLVAIGAACAGRESLWSANYPDVIMEITSINIASINLAIVYFASICLASTCHPYF